MERAPLYVHEVFPSFQGEGIYCGCPQVFVRLSGCNLSCAYCDTPRARRRVKRARIWCWECERESIPNPLGAEELVGVISSLWTGEMHSVSVTGGEPLVQAEALAALFPLLKERDMPVYLETNGTLHEAAERLLPWMDFVAMDMKLPSITGGADLMDDHLRFLRLVRSRDVFLKMVVDEGTTPGEVDHACRRLEGETTRLTLVLQPAWRGDGIRLTPGRARELVRAAAPYFSSVRVMPQAHRAWGVR